MRCRKFNVPRRKFVENTDNTGGKCQNVVNGMDDQDTNILPRDKKPFKGVCQLAGMVALALIEEDVEMD